MNFSKELASDVFDNGNIDEHTAMSAKRLSMTIGLIALLLACKQEEPALYSPSIEFISFADIPTQNVELNQVVRSITVTMPATLTNEKLKTTIRLTPDAELISGLQPDGSLDLSNYCPCTDVSGSMATNKALRKIVLRNTKDGGTGSYWLILKTEKPLAIKSSSTPPTYPLSDKSVHGVVLPVESYYGSRPIINYQLINAGTGQTASFDNDGAGCVNACSPVGANQIFVYLDYFLRNYPFGFGPGTYIIRFRLNDGTVVSTPQPINVVP